MTREVNLPKPIYPVDEYMSQLIQHVKGVVASHTPWTKLGYAGAVTTEQDMRGWSSGICAFPAAALTMTVVTAGYVYAVL
jgi:hypothetical protein